MADFYTWTNPRSSERTTINYFLDACLEHAPRDPRLFPADPPNIRSVIEWMRTKLDLKPSEMLGPDWDKQQK